jgi:hypothetical protein
MIEWGMDEPSVRTAFPPQHQANYAQAPTADLHKMKRKMGDGLGKQMIDFELAKRWVARQEKYGTN